MYLLLCLFSSAMAVLALSSWAAKQGSGFAVDELTGQLTGIGDYRRAVVQAGAAAIGILVAILLSNIDYRSLVNVWPVHVVLTWGLVLPTLVIRNVTIGPLTIGYNAGDTDNYSWYKLGGFTFQPTELAKISFILTFAMHLNNVRSRLNEPKELGKLLLHLFVPIGIIHIQGDDGTAIIYGIIGCCMLFAAGLSWKYIIGAFAALAAAAAAAFAFFSDKIGKGYQWYRILAVIDPNNETGWAPSETIWKNIIYQQQRGEIAIGSGGIFGNGFFGGRYYSVPNAHNDFIFSWIGNAAGFVGCCVVLGVLLAIIIKTFATGACSEDMLGSFICAGIGGAFMAQIFVNVGMNLRLLPVIGVTLPFYSAGGSSVLMLYICVGLVLSAKISFILTFAMHLNNVRSRLNEPKELGKLLLHLFVPIGIIHIQGDDGTAIIYGIIGCCMLFAAGLSWKYIIGAFAALAAAAAAAFAFFSDKIGKGYQWYRILAVIDPNNETGWAPSETIWKNIIYQQQRGEIAIGSGGIFGNGFFGGRYYSVPNAHNDFIFSWIGNAAGFVGCCVVLGVLLAIIIKTFATGACSEDMLGSFICAGIGGAFMAQIFVNVGMNLRLLPVIGVTLPFYSAGGSSVLMLYICVGLVLSVYMHNTKKLFG